MRSIRTEIRLAVALILCAAALGSIEARAATSYQFRVAAVGLKPALAAFALSANTVLFPVTNVGTSATQTLTISNTGTAPGTPVISASGNFASTSCASLPAGGQCTVTLTFTPSTSQTYSVPYTATASVSGAASGPQSVALSGTGATSVATTATNGTNSSWNSPYIPLYSPDQSWYLMMRADCAVATYHNGVAQWASPTAGAGAGCWLALQTDGNLVIYHAGAGTANNAAWSTGSGGHASQAGFMQLSNAGLLSIYQGTPASPGALMWHN